MITTPPPVRQAAGQEHSLYIWEEGRGLLCEVFVSEEVIRERSMLYSILVIVLQLGIHSFHLSYDNLSW